MRITKKNLMLYLVGNLIVSFGIYFMVVSSVGIGPWDTVFENLNIITGLGFWFFNLVFNIIFLTFVILYRRSFEYISIAVTIVIQTVFLFFWEKFVFNGYSVDNLAIQITYFTLAILIIPVGLNFIIISSLPKMIYDEMTFVLMDILKSENFGVVRIAFEIIAVLTGLVISLLSGHGIGTLGIGTLVMTFTLGPLINLYLKFFRKFEDKDLVLVEI